MAIAGSVLDLGSGFAGPGTSSAIVGGLGAAILLVSAPRSSGSTGVSKDRSRNSPPMNTVPASAPSASKPHPRNAGMAASSNPLGSTKFSNTIWPGEKPEPTAKGRFAAHLRPLCRQPAAALGGDAPARTVRHGASEPLTPGLRGV